MCMYVSMCLEVYYVFLLKDEECNYFTFLFLYKCIDSLLSPEMIGTKYQKMHKH